MFGCLSMAVLSQMKQGFVGDFHHTLAVQGVMLLWRMFFMWYGTVRRRSKSSRLCILMVALGTSILFCIRIGSSRIYNVSGVQVMDWLGRVSWRSHAGLCESGITLFCLIMYNSHLMRGYGFSCQSSKKLGLYWVEGLGARGV